MRVMLYTDGSSDGKTGGIGGWATVIKYDNAIATTDSGYVFNATNNRMELMAVLEGLKQILDNSEVTIVTDSKLVIGWLTKKFNRSDERCAEIALEIDRLVLDKNIELSFQHVKGHSGHPENELCDSLAKSARVRGESHDAESDI